MPAASTGPAEPTAAREILRFLLVAALILCSTAWARDLFDADEGRYAAVALAMYESGDWVVPRLDGMPFMDKPPLVYHVQVALYTLFGPSSFAARAPTLLAGVLWALFIFLFARAWIPSRRAAWWAGLLALTSAAGTIGSRVGPQMDMPLAAAVAGVLYAGWCSVIVGGRLSQIGLGVAVGAGLLVKGPLVVAVPGLVAVAWAFAGVDRARLLRAAFAPWAWLVAIAIAAPWYVAVERAMPGWIEHFIVYEHFGRFSKGDHRAFHPFWFYVPIALLYMAPWTALGWGGARVRRGPRWFSAILSFAARSPWSPRPWGASISAQQPVGGGGTRVDVGRLAWLWFVVAFLIYSLASRKLLNYLLPAAAPLFLLLGARLEASLGRRDPTARRLPLLLGLATIGLGTLLWAGLFVPFGTGRLPTSIEAARVSPAGPWFVLAGSLLAAGSLLWTWIGSDRARGLVLILAAALAWACVDLGFARISGIGSSRSLASALTASAESADVVVVYKRYPQGLGFYTDTRLWLAGGTPEAWAQREIVNPYAAAVWGAQPEGRDGLPVLDKKGGLLTQAQFERLWRDPTRDVLLICRWREIAPLGGHMEGGPFAGAGRTDLFLVRNHPPREER